MKKCGTYTWFGYTDPFSERLKAIKEAGFDTICTFWTKEMESMDAERLLQPELADKAGLYLEHTHLSYFGCDALWNDDIKAKEMVAGYMEDIKLAHKAGVPTVVIHPCEIYVPDMARYPIFYENMRNIADVCASLYIKLAIENLGENIAIRRILNDLSDNPFVGLCFDSGHNNVVNHDDFSLLKDYSGRIFALHIHDNNGVKDEHILPYSEGCTVNWRHFSEEIEETGFEGSLMLEACFPIDYDSLDGKNDGEYIAPSYPMKEWLNEAKAACERIYTDKI